MRGGVVGADLLVGETFGVQFELRLAPLVINPAGRFGVIPYVDSVSNSDSFAGATVFAAQFGVGLYKRIPSKRERAPASQWGEEPGQPVQPTPPQPESGEAPERSL